MVPSDCSRSVESRVALRAGDLGVVELSRVRDHFLLDRAVRQHRDREQQLGLERDQLGAAHPGGIELGPDDDRRVTGEAGQQLAGLVEQILERAVGRGEEVCNGAPLGDRKGPGLGEVVDEVAVALVGRDPAGRGVGLDDVPLPLELGHVVADRRARHPERPGLGDRLGRDRLRGLHVLLDDRSQHGGPAVDCVHEMHPRSGCVRRLVSSRVYRLLPPRGEAGWSRTARRAGAP